jgi:hypothetical protein
MRHKIQSILLILFTLSASPALATPTAASKPAKNRFYCPPITALKKDPKQLTWSAERHNYRNYDISFAKNIDAFIGAQWAGTKVGQLTCIYRATPRGAFPILLIFHTLTLEPSDGNWTKNQGGYKNCNSLDRKTCPYQMNVAPQQTNIYKEAEDLKSQPTESFNE